MDCLVNIVHPYTYKMSMNELQVSSEEHSTRRDELFSHFVNNALEKGARVLYHRNAHPYDPKGILSESPFMFDSHYEVLFDEKIDSVVTTPKGIPIADRRPKKTKPENWEKLKKYYSSHSVLKQKVGHPDLTFFIGGYFDACLANAAIYHDRFFRSDDERVFFIPDLCVCRDEMYRGYVEEKLRKRSIDTICVLGALKLMSKK